MLAFKCPFATDHNDLKMAILELKKVVIVELQWSHLNGQKFYKYRNFSAIKKCITLSKLANHFSGS